MANWPQWWQWELKLSSHLLKRMLDRGFSEVDLRLMMEEAKSIDKGSEHGRWVVQTVHEFRQWEVIVEPDPEDQFLVVVTAYPVD